MRRHRRKVGSVVRPPVLDRLLHLTLRRVQSNPEQLMEQRIRLNLLNFGAAYQNAKLADKAVTTASLREIVDGLIGHIGRGRRGGVEDGRVFDNAADAPYPPLRPEAIAPQAYKSVCLTPLAGLLSCGKYLPLRL